MHGETMSPTEAVNPEEALEKALDAKLVQALEARSEVIIPAGFAARVTAQVPARRSAVRRAVLLRSTDYGLKTMVVSLVVLAVILIALLANHFGHTAIGMVMEWIIYAQFLALAAWLGLRHADILSNLWPYRAGR